MTDQQFDGRLALQQRVLPNYRAPFFDALALACSSGLSVAAGLPLPSENITPANRLQVAHLTMIENRHFSQPSSPFYYCWQSGLIKWLESWQPDALVLEANPRYISSPAAIRWMHRRGKQVIGWGLGAPPIAGKFARQRIHSRQKFLCSLDALIAYSPRGAEEYQKAGVSPQRVFIAPNAVAERPTLPMPIRPSEFIGPPRVLFVGRLQERKRLDNLLRACTALPPDSQPQVWIVGDGPARSALEQLAQQIYPQAEFTGARFGEELAGYFKAADLFVLPGTGGLAVQQAMSYGLPVIVAEADGTQENLVRPENGWLVPANNQEALDEALLQAISDPQRLRQKGTVSYKIVSEEVNLERMVAVFVEALNSLR